jgi:hypothetical protein
MELVKYQASAYRQKILGHNCTSAFLFHTNINVGDKPKDQEVGHKGRWADAFDHCCH